jgi:subtilisin family serine protease
MATVKADAAQISFTARGAGVTWAVLDSGIDKTHQHFMLHSNIADAKSPWHRDFTSEGGDPLTDENGHGTHVAGILAGEWRVTANTGDDQRPVAVSRYRTAGTNDIQHQETRLDHISGMAPECKLVSLKVLDEDGKGTASS